MKARITLFALGAAAMLMLGFVPAEQAVHTADEPRTSSADELDARSSDNLELVALIEDPGGTDLEFFSRTLDAYEDADGELVEPEEPVVRHFAAVGNQNSGAKIVDITDPESPYIAARVKNCTVGQGDIQVNAEGTLMTIAWQTSGNCADFRGGKLRPRGSAIVDLRDVYDPKVIGLAPENAGAHNNTLHPDGRHLYISTSGLAPNSGHMSRVPIYDLAGWETAVDDPGWKPELETTFLNPVNGPHDIRFSEDGTRAYFAGISTYNIVNTEDPTDPSIISTIVPPGGTIGHDTLITPDKRFLFLGDEAGGGAPYPCPGGAIYVYDLTVEEAPVLLGAAEAGGGPVLARNQDEVPGPAAAPTGGCTSHVMHLDPGGKSLTLGWYSLGTRQFSFESFYDEDGNAKAAAGLAASWGQLGVGLVETAWIIPEGGRTWSAKQYEEVPGYIFSDDTNLGFYVSKFVETEEG